MSKDSISMSLNKDSSSVTTGRQLPSKSSNVKGNQMFNECSLAECGTACPPSSFEAPFAHLRYDAASSLFIRPTNAFGSSYPQTNPAIQPFGRRADYERELPGFGRGSGVRNANFHYIEPYYAMAFRQSDKKIEKENYGLPLHATCGASADDALPVSVQIENLTENAIQSNSSISINSKKKKSVLRKNADTSGKRVYIDEIHDLDVLCGRGGRSNHHVGNKLYRQVVKDMKMNYRSINGKKGKTNLSRAIVNHVCNYGGRFVKKEDTTGRYYLLSPPEARKKTSQALREMKDSQWTA